MKDGVFSFFASHTAATISTIRSFSSTFHMPFVLANTAFNQSARQDKHYQHHLQQHHHRSELGYELYITPHYARAIVAIIEHYYWKDFWYIYKDDEGDKKHLVVDSAIVALPMGQPLFCLLASVVVVVCRCRLSLPAGGPAAGRLGG